MRLSAALPTARVKNLHALRRLAAHAVYLAATLPVAAINGCPIEQPSLALHRRTA